MDKPIDQNLINLIKIADELHFEELSKYEERYQFNKTLALFIETRKPLNNFLENKYAKKPKTVKQVVKTKTVAKKSTKKERR